MLQKKTHSPFKLDFKCSNNQAEYETLIIGLRLLLDLGTTSVELVGNHN